MEEFVVSGRTVGPGHEPYFIAEIGANHNGDMELAKQLVDAAAACGANAAKFQSWSRTSIISEAEFQRNPSYADKKKHFGSLAEMVERYQLTSEQHREMSAYCMDKGIDFLSSCFSPGEVDLLDSLNVPVFKIASMDINHLPLLRYVGTKGRPVLLSTGMASMSEIGRALGELQDAGSGPICLLHCVSLYPPAHDRINLRNIPMLRDAFEVPVGYSDHTLSTSVSLAAVAVGACVIEKHFTLDKRMEGWDHAVSAEPEEFATIVSESRNVFASLGSYRRVVSPDEILKRLDFRRRVVLARNVEEGHVLVPDDLEYKRPGTGIGPEETPYVVGRKVARKLQAQHELEWPDLV
jgi:N,N'-diacetyllegionaminate synthase